MLQSSNHNEYPLRRLVRQKTINGKSMAFFREPRPEDVANRVSEDYAPEDALDVIETLSKVTGFGDLEQIPWLQLACMRLAAKRKDLLPQWVQLANQDSRDLQLAVEGQYGPTWERDFILYSKRRQ
jgi:hypothetical protein